MKDIQYPKFVMNVYGILHDWEMFAQGGGGFIDSKIKGSFTEISNVWFNPKICLFMQCRACVVCVYGLGYVTIMDFYFFILFS